MKKKILFILAILVISLTIFIVYLNKVFFPVQFKQIVLQKAQEFIGRPVTFDSISFHPIKGIVVTNINLPEKDAADLSLLHVDEISMSILYVPIFREKKIIIPQLTIKSPVISLRRFSQDAWNFSDIIATIKARIAKQAQNPSGPKSSMGFVIGGLTVKDGDLTILDKTVIPSFLETFEDLNLKAALSPEKGIKFSFETNLPKSESHIKLQGDSDLGFQNITAKLQTNNIKIVQYLNFYFTSDKIDLVNGVIQTAQVSLERHANTVTADSQIELSDIDVKWQDKEFQGQLKFPDLKLQYDLGKSALIKGKAELSSVLLSLGNARNIEKIASNDRLNDFPSAGKPNNFPEITGNLSSPDLTIAWQPEKTQINGSFLGTNTSFKINEHQNLAGQIQAQEFVLLIANVPTDKSISLTSKVDVKDLVLTLGENKSVQGQLSLNPISLNLNQGQIELAGNGLLTAANIQLDSQRKLTGDIAISDVKANISPEKKVDLASNLQVNNLLLTLNDHQSLKGQLQLTNLYFDFADGNIDSRGDINISNGELELGSDKKIQGNLFASNLAFSLEKDTIHLKINDPLKLSEGHMTFADKTAQGNLKLIGELAYNINDPRAMVYNGLVFPDISWISGIPTINEILDVTGKIGILNDQIHIETMNFSMADTPIELTGSISTIADPVFNLKATANRFDLSKISLLAPSLLEKIKITPTGQAQIILQVQDKLSNLTPANIARSGISAALLLKDATIQGEKLPEPVTGINGELRYVTNALSWKNLQGLYLEKDFLSNGQLIDFLSPQITGSLISEALHVDLSTKAQWKDNSLILESLNGDYFHSRFDVSGNIRFDDEKPPQLNLNGQMEFNLKDLAEIQPSLQKTLEPIKPEGIISWNGSLKGELTDWKNWTMNFIALSPKITLSGYAIQDLSIKANQMDQAIKNMDVSATIYDGKLKANGSVNLADETFPYQLKMELKDTNLEKLKAATIWKDQNVSGFFSLAAQVTGPLLDWKQMQGQGSALIHDGNIWQLNLLKGLGKIIFTSDYENIPIKEVSADFRIGGKKVTTDNLAIKSPVFTVEGKGWVNFDNQLDFSLNAQFEEKLPTDTQTIQEKISNLVTQFGDIMTIKVTGPLNNPKFSPPIPAPGRIIEKGLKLFLEGVKDAL